MGYWLQILLFFIPPFGNYCYELISSEHVTECTLFYNDALEKLSAVIHLSKVILNTSSYWHINVLFLPFHKRIKIYDFVLSRSTNPQNNRHLNHTKIHSWAKFGDSNLNGWKVIEWTSSKFDFQVKFDLEGQGRPPPKMMGIVNKVFCISDPNLVILAWTVNELSCGQPSDWYTHTDRHTDTGDDNTRRPKLASGQNGRIFNSNLLHGTVHQPIKCQADIRVRMKNVVWDGQAEQFPS